MMGEWGWTVPAAWMPERSAWEMVTSVCMEAVGDANLTICDSENCGRYPLR